MPVFKTTKNILIKKDEDEFFDTNWMDSNKIVLPPNKKWDYKRNLTIEDVDIWEVLYEAGGLFGAYAAWNPFAEFYMITPGHHLLSKGHGIETYSGPNASMQVYKRMKNFGVTLAINQVWVDDDKLIAMKSLDKKILYLP